MGKSFLAKPKSYFERETLCLIGEKRRWGQRNLFCNKGWERGDSMAEKKESCSGQLEKRDGTRTFFPQKERREISRVSRRGPRALKKGKKGEEH